MEVYLYYKDVVDKITELQHEILEHLVSAGTSRGWFPSAENVIERISEHEKPDDVRAAMDELVRFQLLRLDDAGNIAEIIGGIGHGKTRFRAMTADNVPFQLRSSLDALTIAPTLQKTVTVQTTCGVSDAPIEVEVDKDSTIIRSEPHDVTAFIPAWDGEAPLHEALAPRGLFFANDEKLHEWQDRHSDPDGMPLTQDTIRFVGTQMAAALAALYVRMSVR